MPSLKVTTVESAASFILPKEAMAFLKVQKGDTVYLTEAPGGCLEPVPERHRDEWGGVEVAGPT